MKPRARPISASVLAVPAGNTDRLQLQKSWVTRLQKRAGRCQNDIGNLNAGQRQRDLWDLGDLGLIGIVIVAHGGLAREYLSAVEHVVGKQAGMAAIAIADEHDRAAKSLEIAAAADAVDHGDGVVVVTDMFGGSPSNLSLPACTVRNRRILYGANLPMLIKLTKSRELPLADAVALALDAGRKYINSLDLGGEPVVRPEGQE